jgi:hypothetical protein
VKKSGGNGKEFRQNTSMLLQKIYAANSGKALYLPEYFDFFLADCWSYACKTDFFYSMKVYAKSAEKIGIKSGIKDKTVQFLRAVKFFAKNRMS